MPLTSVMPASALSNSHSIHICAARFVEARKTTTRGGSGRTYVEAVGSARLKPDAGAAHHAVAPEDCLVHVAHRWRVEGGEALALAVPVDVGGSLVVGQGAVRERQIREEVVVHAAASTNAPLLRRRNQDRSCRIVLAY